MRRIARALLLAAAACGGDTTAPKIDSTAIKPGAPVKATLVGTPLSAAVATDVHVTMLVTDKNAVAVPNQLVNFIVTSGGGHVFAGSAQTSAVGEAKEIWTLGTKAGNQTIEARAVDQTTGAAVVLGAATATATAGPLSSIRLANSQWEFFVGDGARLADAAKITTADAYGNAVTPALVTYTVTGAAAISHDSIVTTKRGLGSLIAIADGVSSPAVAINSLADLRKSTWKLSAACGLPGGVAQGEDSSAVSLTSVSVTYETQSGQARRDMVPTLAFRGTRTTWPKFDTATVTSVADTIRASQLPDSLEAVLAHGGGFASTSVSLVFAIGSDGKYIAGTLCNSNYSIRRPTVLQAITP